MIVCVVYYSHTLTHILLLSLTLTLSSKEVHKRLQSAEEQAFHLEKALSGIH